MCKNKPTVNFRTMEMYSYNFLNSENAYFIWFNFFFGFADGRIDKISYKMAGVMHDADYAYTINCI